MGTPSPVEVRVGVVVVALPMPSPPSPPRVCVAWSGTRGGAKGIQLYSVAQVRHLRVQHLHTAHTQLFQGVREEADLAFARHAVVAQLGAIPSEGKGRGGVRGGEGETEGASKHPGMERIKGFSDSASNAPAYELAVQYRAQTP